MPKVTPDANGSSTALEAMRADREEHTEDGADPDSALEEVSLTKE